MALKLRILVVAACPLPWPRGTPIRIHRMTEALSERGHDMHVVTYPLADPAIPVPYLAHRIGQPTMRMRPDPGPTLKKLTVLDPLLTRKLRQLAREQRFDLIHAHHYEGLIAALIARSRKDRIPIVYDAHTLLASELPHYRLPLPRAGCAWIGRWLDRLLPGRADHVIAVTERMQSWFVEKGAIPAGRIALIPNGVEHQHFASGAAPPDETELTDGTLRQERRAEIVFAGNLADYQGIDLLLRAFKRVHSCLPRARLNLVTDSQLGSLAHRIGELGLAGHVSAIYADYASLPARLAVADVLVNPRPPCDGIPQKLLNYMAAGRPIVSFAGSAALLENERTGLLVQDGDVEAFAAAILRILQKPQLGRRLGQAAQDQVVARYGWRQVAEKVEAVYAQVMARSTH